MMEETARRRSVMGQTQSGNPAAESGGAVPNCLAPDPVHRRPGWTVPPGACDTHAHVIGPPDRFPYVENRSYTPPEASPGAYLGMLDALGLDRGVLVQVSVHGTDNRCLEEVLRAHPDRLRGVAVVAPDVPDGALEDLAAAGVRGLRLNVLFGGGVGFDALETLASRIAGLGWHLQFLLDARELPALAPRLERLPVSFVVDHMGHMPTAAGLDHPGFQTLLRLVRDGRCWVKLSGTYRISSAGPPFTDTIPFARALVDAAPDRMVWGSDWPHVAMDTYMPNTGDLLDLLATWVPDEAVRRRILVDNPARLYGFE
jgi:2-pyrone-4,6-dicarboxylate lactonase